jgi:hydrogenase small subunit
MQPSLEDVLLGLIPGLPKVHLHNKVLATSLGGTNAPGDVNFLDAFQKGADGTLGPFVFVLEGQFLTKKLTVTGSGRASAPTPKRGSPRS